MTGVYDLKGINEQLENNLDEAKALLKAWQSVTYPTKKNGDPFAVMSKNFNGATYKKTTYSWHDYETELSVTTYGKKYYTDSIYCYESMTYRNKEYSKPENIIDNTYVYDLDDIKAAVNERIEYYKKRIDALEKDMKNSEKVYNYFLNDFQNAMEKLKNNSADSTLASLVRDTVIEHNSCRLI